MRLMLLPLYAAAAAAAPTIKPDAMLPGYSEPAQRWGSVEQAADDKICADRIEQVRQTAGQPKLDRTPIVPGEPLMIAAVDKRIDGCAVIQMHRDVNDVRPLAAPVETPARLQPAH